MNCESFQDKIQKYNDNELEKGFEPILFEHLSKCGECREFMKSLNVIENYIAAERNSFPAELDDKILKEISNQNYSANKISTGKIFRKMNYQTYFNFAFALILLAMLVFFTGRDEDLKSEIEFSKNLIEQKEKEIQLMQNALNEITVKTNYENEIVVTTSL